MKERVKFTFEVDLEYQNQDGKEHLIRHIKTSSIVEMFGSGGNGLYACKTVKGSCHPIPPMKGEE